MLTAYKKFPFLLLSIYIVSFCVNQAYSQADLPKIIHPSPEASQLFRFQDYPMDYSTGLPQISIPIYEVKSGSLSVPISISYHASGRKVYDQDGPIAVGWSLNAGGMISRTVYGAVDFGTTTGTFKFPYPFTVTGLSNQNTLPYIENMMHFDKNPDDVSTATWTDGEYDMFSYSFNSNGGKFFFKDNNSIKTPELLPYKPYVITPVYNSSGLTSINILDDKGVFYNFVAYETTLQAQSSIETVQASTGFVLTQMISADKTDTITFKYTAFSQTRTSISQQIVWNDMEESNTIAYNSPPVPEGPTQNEITDHSPYQMARLTEIDFKQGKVLFNLVSGSDKINTIQIVNLANQVVKTIQTNRSLLNNLGEIGYSTNNLTSLAFKDNAGNAVETFSFLYYPNAANPDPNQPDNTVLNVRYRDWWGYYNASGVHDMVPYYTNQPYTSMNGASTYNNYTVGNFGYNRSPNLLGLESGVLQKIIYPTGGSTEFVYETNRYYSYAAQQIKDGPGLRVNQIKNSDNNGTITYKTYKYGDNENGYGTLDMEPSITNMAAQYNYQYFPDAGGQTDESYRSRTYFSDFLPQLSEISERPVIYQTVTEYQGTPSANIGKTIYKYDYSPWAPAGMPAFQALAINKTQIYNYNYWNSPSLIEQTVYKNSSAIKQKTTHTYNATTTETVSGLHVQRVYNFPQSQRSVITGYYAEPYAAEHYSTLFNIYTYSDYQIPVGYKNLTSTTVSLYSDDGTHIDNTTSYTYNSHQYVSQTSMVGSDNKTIYNQVTYPFDYSSNSVLTQMSSASVNMLNFPVEQTELKNTATLKKVRTNFYNWGGSSVPNYAIQSVDVAKGTNPYETRMSYSSYDSYGNPLSVSKDKDVHLSYIWDYQHRNPIAEVINGDPSEIAYTSFEADGSGNWTGINSGNVTTGSGITGSKFYNLNATGLSMAGLSASKEYTVTYWSTNGAYSVSGNSKSGWPKSVRTITLNGVSWTCWEHKITGTTAITISGSGAIDELRLCPSVAQMKTYTYIPLIGLSAVNDFNNRLNFYEYDAYGRLNLIRDMNGNVIKTMTYQYQSSTP